MFKKILFVSLAVITLASSCKKDNDGGSGTVHLTAKINGTSASFNLGVSAQKDNGDKTVTIGGTGGSASSPFPALAIDIDDDAVITNKAYTAADGDIFVMYAASMAGIYANDNDFTVTVTSISSTEIKGTFSGKVTDGGTTLNVTEGSFYAKFQ